MDFSRFGKIPLSARARRNSAPTTLPENNTSALLEIPLRREWVTKHQAVWRTGPSPLSQKLGDIPAGLRVIESKVPHFFPMQCEDESWIPIAPKGYLQTADLTAVTFGDYSESALAALREEGIQLREINVGLREQELVARAELKETQEAASTVCSELDSLREQLLMENLRCDAEKSCLERCHQRRLAMKRKLVVCADAVKNTVECIDRFNNGDALREEVKAAGVVIAELLESSPSDRADCEEKAPMKESKATEEPELKACTSRLFNGQENETSSARSLGKGYDDIIDAKATAKAMDNTMPSRRVPLQAMNE